MVLYGILFMIGIVNFLLGTMFGFNLARMSTNTKNSFEEKSVYCHGFEDGVYYTVGEYTPDLFKVEIAENCYREYKAIKYGPEKH